MEKESGLAMTHESMNMEREFRLAMTHKSMHALEVRIHNVDRKLSLYQIAKLSELMPYCMLTRKGYWITNLVRPKIGNHHEDTSWSSTE